MNPDLPTSQGDAPLPPPGAPPPGLPPQRTPTDPGADVLALVRRYRARQKRQLWLEALLWGGAAFVVLLLAAGLVAKSSTVGGQVLAFLAPLALLGSLVVLGALRVRREVGDDARSARRVGEVAHSLGEDALSAVELKGALGQSTAFSEELARAFLDDADARARSVKVDGLVDPRPVRRAGLGALGALAAIALVVFVWPARWSDGFDLLLGETTDPRTATRYEPITGDIEITYRYPAYTGLSPRTVSGTAGDISAPAGTEVTLRTRSDRPVRRADVIVNGEALPLQVDGERDLKGSFVLEKPGAYHFRFVNALGREAARGPDLPINVEADVAPKVELQMPKPELEIDPGDKVSLRYEAADDYGVTSLELVFRTPGGKEHRVPLPKEDGRVTRENWNWDMAGLKLKPGDRVAYHVEAKDNDAVAGPKKGVSRTQVVRIYSAAEHRRLALQKAEELWNRLVLMLADRLEGGDLEEPLEKVKVQSQQRVDDAGVTLAQDFYAAAGELSKERDAPTELVTALVNISDGYGKVARQTRDVRRMFIRYSNRFDLGGDFGRRLTAAVRDEVEELEKDILYLESLIDRRKLEELKALADQLKQEQRDLASLVEEFQKTQDPELRQQIMEQISSLRQRISELAQRMQELAKGIRDEHLNAEALQQMMEEQNMGDLLDEIEKLMREGKTEEALKKLQELSMQLDEMQKSLDDAQDNFGEEQFPELAEKFRDFMQDLQQTADEQKAVAQQTRELRDRYQKKMKERLNQKGDALKNELLKKVEEASREYSDLNPDRLSYGAERDLEQVQKELENARNALKVEDFDLAAEAAARAERAAEELQHFGEQQRQLDEAYGNPPEVRQESDKLAQKLDKNAQTVREVNQSLQQLFPPAGQMMSEQDQQKLKELSKEQQQLQQRAQGLQQKMDEMSQMAPIFDEQAQQQMEQVGQRMGDANQRMQARDPSRAHGEQQAALDQLQQFEQQMQQSMQQRKGGRGIPLPMMAGKRPGGGSSNANEDVEIPDAEQYQAPKEFRKDILDAMKQGAPEKYKDQVKRYYEELVR